MSRLRRKLDPPRRTRSDPQRARHRVQARCDFLTSSARRRSGFRWRLRASSPSLRSSCSVFVYWQTVEYASEEIDEEVMQTGHAIGDVRKFYVDRRLKRWLAEQNRIVALWPSARRERRQDRGQSGANARRRRLRRPRAYARDQGCDGDSRRTAPRWCAAVALKTADRHVAASSPKTPTSGSISATWCSARWPSDWCPIVGLGCLGGALFGRSTLARMAAMDRSFDRIVSRRPFRAPARRAGRRARRVRPVGGAASIWCWTTSSGCCWRRRLSATPSRTICARR